MNDIEDARSATYTPVDGDAADPRYYLKATANYTDGEDSGQTADMVSVNQILPDTTNKAPYFPDTDPDTEGMQDEGRERSVLGKHGGSGQLTLMPMLTLWASR